MTPEEKNMQLERRIASLEHHIASLEHALDMAGIVKPSTYPPYIPWTTPMPVESMFSPSKFQCIERETLKNVHVHDPNIKKY